MTAPRAKQKATLIELQERQLNQLAATQQSRWLEQGREIEPDPNHADYMRAGIAGVLVLVSLCLYVYGRSEGWWG